MRIILLCFQTFFLGVQIAFLIDGKYDISLMFAGVSVCFFICLLAATKEIEPTN